MVSLIPKCDTGSVGGTWTTALGGLVWSSLAVSGEVYGRRSGRLFYGGARPGAGWHAHGTFRRWLRILAAGVLRKVEVEKQRWLHAATGRTCHSRPPDDLPWLHFCALVVALKLWGWLDGGRGLDNAPEVIPDLYGKVSSRTQQRWLGRALPYAMEIQQAIRLAVIERSEPRPVETLFPGGLSPPVHLTRRSWRDPPAVEKLWRALAFLVGGALGLSVPVAVLLAEARGRWDETRDSKTP